MEKARLFKTANESVIRALRNAYVGRRLKKRDFRRLMDSKNKCCFKNEWTFLFKIHEWNKISWS